MPQRIELADDLLHLGLAVERLAAVLVAVDTEHDLGRQLRVAIQHAAGTEIGTAARPDRADAGRRQHRDDGLRRVRQVGNDAVAGLHTQPGAQLGGQDAHLAAELFPGHARQRRALTEVHQRGGVGALVTQGMLSVVQPRAGKPLRTRHPAVGQHALVRRGGLRRGNSPRSPARTPRDRRLTTATAGRSCRTYAHVPLRASA